LSMMDSDIDLTGVSPVALMVEDPGAVNFLAPLVDRLIKESVSVTIYGVGVGATQLRSRGHVVAPPPCAQEASALLERGMFKALITGTCEDPHSPAFDLLRAARASRIPTIGVVDASVNAQFRFRGTTLDPLAHAPDWLIVPDEATTLAFDSLGFPKSNICMVGNPARDLAKKRGREIRNDYIDDLSQRRGGCSVKRVVFVSEISDGLNPSQYMQSAAYTLAGRGTSRARTMIVVEEFLDGCARLQQQLGRRATLVLRLHPKQQREDLGLLVEEFDEVSTGGDPLEMVASADVVVGMSSMLLQQAYDIGVPCLAILPRGEELAWLPEVAAGRLPAATTRQEVQTHLQRLWEMPHPRKLAVMGRDLEQSDGISVSEMVRFVFSVCRTSNGFFSHA
jgi:hypothetical protein